MAHAVRWIDYGLIAEGTIGPIQEEHGSGPRNLLDFSAQRDETLAQMLDQPEEQDQPETLDQLPPSDEGPSGGLSIVPMWWPIIGASVVIICFSIAVSVAQMFRSYPRDPWESIIIADAYRYSVGMPVYTNPYTETGHATHMYGPLLIYAVGLIFKWKGMNVVAAHLVPLIATIWVIAALAVIYFRGLPRAAQIAGVAILVSLNTRLSGLPTGLHTDMPAIGFALLALILMFQALEKGRWVFFPLALGSFCVAYLFKQTAAGFTIVPLFGLLLRRERSLGIWLSAAAPLASILLLILAVSVIAPNVHFYMIKGVGRWPMRFDVLLMMSPLRFLGFYILLPIALFIIILTRPISFSDPKMRWLVSAGVATVPGCLLAYSKVGGSENSFLPGLMALLVLSTLVIAAAWEKTSATLAWRGRASMFGWLIALVMMVDGLDMSLDALHLFPDGNGDEHYPQVVEYVRKSKARILCPQDPTIPIVALGQPGRSYWAESDSQLGGSWGPLQNDILRADYVIIVNSPYKKISLNGQNLGALGFVRATWDGYDYDLGVYELWRKSETGRGTTGPSTN